MKNIQDEWELVFRKLGFNKDSTERFNYILFDNHVYGIKYEGYAWVLYQRISIYTRPFTFLFNIYNKFNKDKDSIKINYSIPIAHFRDPEKFITLINIILDDLKDENN